MIVSSRFTHQANLLRAGIKARGHKIAPHCIYFNDSSRYQLQLLMPNE